MVNQPTRTMYNNQAFATEQEARWAVFFDNLSVPWEYEKQEFHLPYGGAFTPDFWIPDQQFWVDIKPDLPSEDQIIQVADLSFFTRKWVYLVWGAIGKHAIYAFNLPFYEQGYDKRFVFTLSEQTHELIVASPLRGNDAYQFIGYCHSTQQMELQKIENVLNNPRLLAAYTAAQHARFD
jgi:hypothetical protein